MEEKDILITFQSKEGIGSVKLIGNHFKRKGMLLKGPLRFIGLNNYDKSLFSNFMNYLKIIPDSTSDYRYSNGEKMML